MNEASILIKAIQQKDNHTMSIDWNDGTTQEYRLSDLQYHCPCALCYDVNTQKKRLNAKPVDTEVKAVRIYNAGLYALRIDFTSGCSMGIYRYSMLKEFEPLN